MSSRSCSDALRVFFEAKIEPFPLSMHCRQGAIFCKRLSDFLQCKVRLILDQSDKSFLFLKGKGLGHAPSDLWFKLPLLNPSDNSSPMKS
jgi:hypothetical protein